MLVAATIVNLLLAYDSRYRDLNSCDPLYAFGYGLSYTTFAVTNLQLSSSTVAKNGSVTASVDVENTGSRAGADVVQLYIHDPVHVELSRDLLQRLPRPFVPHH